MGINITIHAERFEHGFWNAVSTGIENISFGDRVIDSWLESKPLFVNRDRDLSKILGSIPPLSGDVKHGRRVFPQDITYEYNNNYQITKEIHSDGAIITYEYETTNGLFSSTNINNRGNITQIKYNQAKNELSFGNPNGLIHIYDFDELGRKTQITIQDSANTYTTNYSYDRLGRLDKLTDGSGMGKWKLDMLIYLMMDNNFFQTNVQWRV